MRKNPNLATVKKQTKIFVLRKLHEPLKEKRQLQLPFLQFKISEVASLSSQQIPLIFQKYSCKGLLSY